MYFFRVINYVTTCARQSPKTVSSLRQENNRITDHEAHYLASHIIIGVKIIGTYCSKALYLPSLCNIYISLNLIKANIILFCSHKKIFFTQTLKLYTDIQQIAQVAACKFLGVFIDSHLTWKEHIAYDANFDFF